MEDILALIVVLVVIGSVVAIARIVYKSYKEHKRKEVERQELIQKKLDEVRYSPSQWAPVTPQQYADAIPKRKPAMKKANNSTSYANTPMTTTSSTSTAAVADDGFFSGVVTGMLVDEVVKSFSHKSEPSIGVTKSESSWGFDDSDSRKSISDSMDTSSSWSSSSSDSWSSSSSDSGPSSDW